MSVTAISSYEPESYTYYTHSFEKIQPEEDYISTDRKKVEETEKSSSDSPDKKSVSGEELSPHEKRRLEKLKKRDAEVKAHEQAHISAGGGYVRGGAHYEYITGPDGNRYANGGEVSIEVSEVPDNPQATVEKARIVRRAALAPAEPSSTDRAIAAEATRMEQKAQQEIIKLKSKGKKEITYNSKGEVSQVSPEPAVVSELI